MTKSKIRVSLIASVTAFVIGGMALAAGTVNWGYVSDPDHDVLLPSEWATEFPLCGGDSQSPVDLDSDSKQNKRLDPIEFNYGTEDLVVLNNGHTIEVEIEHASTISANGVTYDLAQFHFHTDSEHAVDGRLAPMEVHFVHWNADQTGLAVVGVLMKKGDANAEFQKILDNAPASAGINHTHVSVDPNAFLPTSPKYYNYSGSLTTPGCNEIVNWHVMLKPITVSRQQIAQFRTFYAVNNRPLQPLNGRKVVIGGGGD